MHPLERLINLVALLLETARPLTFQEIRRVMPAYQQGDVASAKRMFERDKDSLRDVGIPVAVGPTDPWDVEQHPPGVVHRDRDGEGVLQLHD